MKPAANQHPPVQLGDLNVQLTPELREHLDGMNDLGAWHRWIAEQNSAQIKDESCPKCQVGRLRFYQPKSRFQCDQCGFVEKAPAKQ
jgi:ribosomal protein S27AE